MYSTARETAELVNDMELSRTGFARLHLTTIYIFLVKCRNLIVLTEVSTCLEPANYTA
jgi:hypothetical protein